MRVWHNLRSGKTSEIIPVGTTGMEITIVDQNGGELFEGETFDIHVEDKETNSPIQDVTVYYKAWDPEENEWIHTSESKQTDSNGDASFIACDIPSHFYTHYADCFAYASHPDYADAEQHFTIEDLTADIHGYVYVAGTTPSEPIGDALVFTDHGGYTFTTQNIGNVGYWKLFGVNPGTYVISASTDGFITGSTNPITFSPLYSEK